MPFFRFHGTDKEKLSSVNEEMTDCLQHVMDCPREYIVIEVIQSDILTNTVPWPFVEISYFERPKEVEKKVADILYKYLNKIGYKESDIYFHILSPSHYYENGVPIS